MVSIIKPFIVICTLAVIFVAILLPASSGFRGLLFANRPTKLACTGQINTSSPNRIRFLQFGKKGVIVRVSGQSLFPPFGPDASDLGMRLAIPDVQGWHDHFRVLGVYQCWNNPEGGQLLHIQSGNIGPDITHVAIVISYCITLLILVMIVYYAAVAGHNQSRIRLNSTHIPRHEICAAPAA
uniref:Uncharacterized protein n=1 Tax=Spongospora subterranea TaxID=70186 RepID=A0A0H5R1G9_9EUKA|eukprot:CRZ07775.1 hypothetical protein [Spongospora subterranea]